MSSQTGDFQAPGFIYISDHVVTTHQYCFGWGRGKRVTPATYYTTLLNHGGERGDQQIKGGGVCGMNEGIH